MREKKEWTSFCRNVITLVAQVVLADSSVAWRTLRTGTSMLVRGLTDPVSPEGERAVGSEPITEPEYNLQT